MTKTLAHLLSFYRVSQASKNNPRGPQAILTITVQFMRAFFRTWGVVENEIFWKKRIISSEKNIVAHFFSWYRTLQMS